MSARVAFISSIAARVTQAAGPRRTFSANCALSTAFSPSAIRWSTSASLPSPSHLNDPPSGPISSFADDLVALVSELGLGLLLEVGVADDFRLLAGVVGRHGEEGGVLEGPIFASIDTERGV